MFIDHKRKLVFVHVPKTGGTSITKTLRSYIKDGVVSGDTEAKHWSAWRIMQEHRINPTVYTITAVVRNPWDMIASDYQFCLNFAKKIGKVNQDKVGGWFSKLQRIAADPSLERFVLLEHLNRPDEWHHYCTDHRGHVLVSRVMRYETLDKDFSLLCRDFGYPSVKLMRVNVTQGRRTYQDLFLKHPGLVAEIGRHYATYCEKLGYSF